MRSTAPQVMWYVVVNAERTALAIYGSALGDMAKTFQEKLNHDFPFTKFDVVTTTGAKPRIGSKV